MTLTIECVGSGRAAAKITRAVSAVSAVSAVAVV
jgi:hypothetical protein